MKKTLLFLLFLCGISNAQTVYVPDPGFKYNLIQNGVDTSGDGNIQVSEALATTTLSLHHLENDFIEDITGLEAFVNLTHLSMNGWPSLGGVLDVSMMPNLVFLDCSVDYLTQINVAGLSHLETLICEFNSITSLDLSGCASLKELNCGDTGITTLDLSQTPNLEKLTANYCSLASANFNSAPALKKIECNEASLTLVDVSALTQLEELLVADNNITSLHLGAINSLTNLDCSNNALASLDVSAQTNLNFLYCGGNALSAINVAPLVNLQGLDCSLNQITSLNLPLPVLELLYCTDNLLTTLDVSALPSLKVLSIGHNAMTAIDLTPLTNLTSFDCWETPIASLDFTSNPQLGYLFCPGIEATSLDVSMLPLLSSLNCGNPELAGVIFGAPGPQYISITDTPLLQSLDLSGVSALDSFSLGTNALSTIDFSSCPMARFINIMGNDNLTYINGKNGNPQFELMVSGAPNLAYICANEANIEQLSQQYPDVSVNSYCTFVPGGTYNTITGTVRFDANLNGCDASDGIVPLVKIKIDDGTTNEGAAFLDHNSAYTFLTGAGHFTLAPVFEEPSYFNFSVVPAVDFAAADSSSAQRNICIMPNGIQPDVEILIVPLNNARPGFDSQYQLVYRNKGNQTVNGVVALTFDGSRLDLVSANPITATQSANTLTWNYFNLQPFETRAIEFAVNVNSPMETPAVNDGDVLDYLATLEFSVPDVSTHTTSAALHQTVVNSLDPNDKTCLEGNTIAPEMIGNYVHYNINFENIGTAPAQNVVVKDVIDTAKFDVATLQVVYASHPVVTRVDGNKAEFIFENINLPGTSGQNKGNVVFKIKTKPTLVLGNTISNKAGIFFDYNFPIETNEATSTFAILKNNDFVADATIGIYPNPTKNKINVRADSNIRSLQLFDMQGRILKTTIENTKETSVDIANQQSDIYFLNVTTEKGTKTEKIIKQ